MGAKRITKIIYKTFFPLAWVDISMLSKFIRVVIVAIAFTLADSCTTPEVTPGWPTITKEAKPWTRWWWHGNALTKEGITAEMEAYQKAGLGGLEITPIYGVIGYEEQFIDYLSPEWITLFLHTLREAERLGLGIDMATGTGWPFGGPWVSSEDASKNIQHNTYELKGGESLSEKIEFIQSPYLRAVANQVYEVDNRFSADKPRKPESITTTVMKPDVKKVDIKQLIEPIGANNNLQALALEQVQFEKPLKLSVLMGYNDKGEIIDLTSHVTMDGTLNWKATDGNWKLYAVFEGWHGKMVERAGPGGEGYVIDHFSSTALRNYLKKFDSAFAGKDITSLRAFFNDSYEVDDAKGTASWTPTLFQEFQKRRGYDLKKHLPALLGQADEETNERVLCDYRETIAEMLLENFTQPWKAWAQSKSKIVRNQAHGSPSNILDLYATVDIPEIEGVEPLRIKMASSAGNVTGKKLVSSESATWLNEHFESNLSDIKLALDRFMLNGVNHVFYHGTAYSPPNEPWPGWLFYAAVHLNPRNPLWRDFDALNEYAARCQSFLQNSSPDNDVLLYYPVYDRYSAPDKELIEHFDGIGKQFENTAFERSAKSMIEKGYAFDYISDKQIMATNWIDESLKTERNSLYKTLVIPQGRYLPVTTYQKIISLADQGATIIAFEGLRKNIAGYGNLEENQRTFRELQNKLTESKQLGDRIVEYTIGKGRILVGNQLDELLQSAAIRKEKMVEQGIDFIRKKENSDRLIYLISNRNKDSFEGWISLTVKAQSAVLYDPLNGEFGKAGVRENDQGMMEVFVRLATRQTMLIETYQQEVDLPEFHSYSMTENKTPLEGTWKVEFISGGPSLPSPYETDSLTSWTNFGNEHKIFSGTAAYHLTFAKPQGDAAGWLLDLGDVKESAEVFLNGKSHGKLIGPVYQLYLNEDQLKDTNTLEVHITNLMANRIADLDKRNVFWKKFYNINFPARKAENRRNGLFDASGWEPKASGLLGPVTLTSLRKSL